VARRAPLGPRWFGERATIGHELTTRSSLLEEGEDPREEVLADFGVERARVGTVQNSWNPHNRSATMGGHSPGRRLADVSTRRHAMVTWRIDKQSRVPLYVQLRELVRYYVSTGAIAGQEQLPGVFELSRALGVNFETVRKAYKELEREGLIRMRRGMGTFVTGAETKPRLPRPPVAADDEEALIALARRLVAELLETGVERDRARAIIETAFDDVATRQFVIFTECNALQVRQISALLGQHLPVKVNGVLLAELSEEVARALPTGNLTAVITTGFHVNEVRKALRGVPLEVDFVVTNMSPDTRRKIEAYDKNGRFAFICRDHDSVPFYRDMFKAELQLPTDPTCCTVEDTEALERVLASSDVVLTSPPVHEEVLRHAPPGLPIFNVMDRVDPLSLRAIKERVFHG
jgi:DNA-binding transcriptional regulator YhcF (GntR family)